MGPRPIRSRGDDLNNTWCLDELRGWRGVPQQFLNFHVPDALSIFCTLNEVDISINLCYSTANRRFERLDELSEFSFLAREED